MLVEDYISPTFRSSSLFRPGLAPQGGSVDSISRAKTNSWGTHIHQYAGIGRLRFLASRSKTRDLYVARSHRHYLSGLSFVRHEVVTPSKLTPFKKALNRANDDLVPPAANIPIEAYNRLFEQNHFVRDDKYASHKSINKLIPQRPDDDKREQPLRDDTAECIRALLLKRYGQTVHSESYYDQRAGTMLKLGPQFQFYDSEDEEQEGEGKQEESKDIEEGTCSEFLSVLDNDNAEKTEKDETVSDEKVDTDEDKITNEEETEGEEIEDSAENKDNNIEEGEKEDDSNTDTVKEKDDPGDTSETEQQEDENSLWPLWPGNHSNIIDLVTTKIAEKRDVFCHQDKYDPRCPQVLHSYKTSRSRGPNKDYKLPKLDHGMDQFAPANVNFAYSGHQTVYGSAAERSDHTTIIPINKLDRFRPLSKNIESNIDRLISENDRHRHCDCDNGYDSVENQHFSRRRVACSNCEKCGRGCADKAVTSLRRPKTANGLEDLEKTINSLRAPSEPVKQKLPPLWETLKYSGDRVVDRLGVQFKTAAQKRYHEYHPDSIPDVTQTIPYPQMALNSDMFSPMHVSNQRRRQYYRFDPLYLNADNEKPIQMGSSFR